MRYAIYFAPNADSMLWRAGCRWLGRDPVAGTALEQPTLAEFEPVRLRELTTSPRRYGFHATLKPPFTLAEGASRDELYAELAGFARKVKAFELPRLQVTRLGGFLALCLSQPSEQLQTLAAECIARFDRFRQPPTGDDLARRAHGISANQKRLLDQWGYPYVMDEWRFHMTLTGPIGERDADAISACLTGYFHDAVREVVWVSDLCVFVEPSVGADFHLAARFTMSEAN